MARKARRKQGTGRAAAKSAVKSAPDSEAGSSAGAQLRSRATPRGGGKRLRVLTSLAATMEIFADEVQHTYRKWTVTKPTTGPLRQKCSEDLRLVAAHGESVLLQYRNARFRIVSDGATAAGPKEDGVYAAFDVAEAADCEQILARLIEVINAAAGRMDVPYSTETQKKIADDARAMNKLAQLVREIADAVRTRCRRDVPHLRLPNPVANALESLKDHVKLTLSDMAGVVADPAESVADIDQRIEAIVKRANGVTRVSIDMRRPLAAFVKQHLDATKQIDRSLANDLDFLLERVGFLIGQANAVVEFAAGRLEAARTVDADIPDGARELDAALRVMRDEHEALRNMLACDKEKIAQAPYRYFRRTKPVPEWDALAEKDREIVAVMVQLRHGDPDGDRAWVTQAMIETAMGHTAGRPPSSSVFKALVRLQDDHQIVGHYPMPRSNQQQHGVNHFWINEDAFEKYRPHALGRSRKAT